MAEKAEDAFRTIGEMAEEIGVKPHILRYWEQQFPMLNPLKRAGGRRHYRPEDTELLRRIQSLLQERGFTIMGARRYLESQRDDATVTPADDAVRVKNPAAEGQVPNALRSIRERLATALDAA